MRHTLSDAYLEFMKLKARSSPVYEVANYFVLSRILYYIPYQSPIHPGRVYTTFIAMGGVIEAITANGAVRVANSSNSVSSQNTGKALLKAALILQIALMVGFVALAGKFQRNCSREGVLNHRVKRALVVLYCSCTLITIRTIYRTVEYFTAAALNVSNIQHISPILKQEWFFYVFEAVVMFINTVMLNVFHPMQVLPRCNNIYLAEDGETEIEGPGYDDPRPWYVTVVDPFDLYGLIVHRGKKEKYWETRATPKPDNTSPAAGGV